MLVAGGRVRDSARGGMCLRVCLRARGTGSRLSSWQHVCACVFARGGRVRDSVRGSMCVRVYVRAWDGFVTQFVAAASAHLPVHLLPSCFPLPTHRLTRGSQTQTLDPKP